MLAHFVAHIYKKLMAEHWDGDLSMNDTPPSLLSGCNPFSIFPSLIRVMSVYLLLMYYFSLFIAPVDIAGTGFNFEQIGV